LRVMSRRYVDALRRFPENNPNLGGLFALTGFNQIAYPIEKPYKGSTSYNLSRRIATAVTFLVSFSTRPAYALLLIGVGVLGLTAVGALLIAAQKLILGSSVTGWSSLAVLILFSLGFSIVMNGVTLIYIVEISKNVRGWPLTIIKEIYQSKPEDRSAEGDGQC
jgi:putative glycosyltransferase